MNNPIIEFRQRADWVIKQEMTNVVNRLRPIKTRKSLRKFINMRRNPYSEFRQTFAKDLEYIASVAKLNKEMAILKARMRDHAGEFLTSCEQNIAVFDDLLLAYKFWGIVEDLRLLGLPFLVSDHLTKRATLGKLTHG